ncbi:MAG: hypothetical protein LC109_05290 [Bacteroidia bacterium]|nr:hypothetical protein [Bacteroidia bacterium]
MKEFINKGFNELFLNEISKFDSRKYAYDIFFNSEWDRFWEIAKHYDRLHGRGAYDYMMKTKYSWKNGTVGCNSGYNIISSTACTYSVEEKFVEAYTQLSTHIKSGFPKRIQLKEVNRTFEQIIEKIGSFNLEKTSYYSKYIYNGSELEEYQSYVQTVFNFYTKTIFENLNRDIELFVKVYDDINTAFLTTSFNTYLYNIEIGIHNVVNKKFEIKKVFELVHPVSYENLLNNKIATFSLERVSQIAKANDTTKIDAFLTEVEIEKIVSRKKELESSKNKGTITMTLKTNSGILKINLRILSPNEKAVLVSRVLVFIAAVSVLANYCFVKTSSFFIFAGGLFVLSFLVTPIYMDIINFTKDIFKSKK